MPKLPILAATHPTPLQGPQEPQGGQEKKLVINTTDKPREKLVGNTIDAVMRILTEGRRSCTLVCTVLQAVLEPVLKSTHGRIVFIYARWDLTVVELNKS